MHVRLILTIDILKLLYFLKWEERGAGFVSQKAIFMLRLQNFHSTKFENNYLL